MRHNSRMRWITLVLLLSVACGSQPVEIGGSDAGADMTQMMSGSAPSGFGASCSASIDCRKYTVDSAPGFLGCYSFIGVGYCSRPCGDDQPPCWTGTSCTCAPDPAPDGHVNTVCYCSR